MKIGTALTPNATKALLLGSGELGKEIAISLQRYGVEVIAVDRYPNAPAQHIAQRSHVIDMTNVDAVKKLIAVEKPDYIIPEIEAIATEALAEIEAEGLSKVVPNARAVQLTMNREGIRTMAAEKVGVPTSSYAFAETFKQLKEAADNITGYPCFIKPTMSSSGKGQSMVTSADQLEKAWEYAKAGGRTDTGKVIIEGAINFDYEITLLTVRALDKEGKADTYFCEPIGHLQQDGDYRESWQPQEMTPMALQNAQEIALAVTNEIGGLGLFGVELFIKGDEVWFSEVSPRPHDTGMVTMVTQRQTEFDLHARAILGLPVCTTLDKIGASAVILGGINAKNIEYTGLDKALEDTDVDVRLFAKPEAYITRRMGVAVATSKKNVKEARAKAVKAASLIYVKG
ncbi:MAG: formate-dependent phosphoribosylglycinamide formyltransferase [Methylococcaceae bacterium]